MHTCEQACHNKVRRIAVALTGCGVGNTICSATTRKNPTNINEHKPTNCEKGLLSTKKMDGFFTFGSICDPGGIQTHDFRNRNPTFYSAELRGLLVKLAINNYFFE